MTAMLTVLRRRAAFVVASALLMLTMAVPAYAQTNPFSGAGAEIDTWVGYGLAAGAIGAIILAAVGVGKAVFRRLAG